MLPLSGAGRTHPKNVLYDEVYEPLTFAFFVELEHSGQRAGLLAEAPRQDLLDNLNALNSLIHDLVDACFDAQASKLDYMLAVVRSQREHVLWEDQLIPRFNASDEEIRKALSHKIKRNISMGAVEIVICLEGAIPFCRDRLALAGKPLARVLKQSGQLAGSLALLHDVQEQQRLQALTGEDGYLKYPEVSFADIVVSGRYSIPPEKYVAVGSGDQQRLRFVTNRVDQGPFDTPIRRCPAFLHTKGTAEGNAVLNEDLWGLIVDLYELSGRL